MLEQNGVDLLAAETFLPPVARSPWSQGPTPACSGGRPSASPSALRAGAAHLFDPDSGARLTRP